MKDYMITVKSWFIKIHKDGQPVIITEGYGIEPFERIVPTNNEVVVSQEGLIVKHKNKEFFCGFDKIKYRNTPTTLQHQIDAGIIKITNKHILHLFYEIASGVLVDKCPVVVRKTPFNLSCILEKYLSEFEDKISSIDFQAIVDMIPEQ